MNRTRTRLWDLPSTALLILILLTTGQRLYITHWTWGMGTAVVLSLIALALGLALGTSQFKQITVSWITIVYSIPVIILVLGGMWYPGISWLERVADISNRLAYALALFITKQPVQDTILFVVFMALVFWTIGLMAGYAMTRYGNIIGAVLPAGVVLVIIQLYDSGKRNNDTLLAIFFILCLLLLGRLMYAQRRLFWKEQRVSVLTESRADLNITLGLVAVASVLLVWLAPTSVESFSHIKTTWENLTQPLRDVQKELGHAVAGLQTGGKIGTIQFFSDTLALGRQAPSGETVYFQIQTPLVINTERYYWRVRSYNIYSNGQWSADGISNTPFTPDQGLIPLADPEGVTSKFTITALSANLATLVTPARPVWVSNPAELSFVKVPTEKIDPVQFRPDSPVLAGEKYDVRANMYNPTILQLRSAGDVYAEWVTRNYLQLPGNLPTEIKALAKQITAHEKTPYDMAAAITAYMRGNFTYSSSAENPPTGQDPLEWFLFGSRSGFCNYFATAEVILLRAAGIPARLVVGFAQGEYENSNIYLIRQRDSHAWPEVYFPDIGWVEFEPTTNQAALERPLGENFTSSEQEDTERPGGLNPNEQNIPEQSGEKGTGQWKELLTNLLRLILRLIMLWEIIVTILWLYTSGAIVSMLKATLRYPQAPFPVLLKRFLEKRALTPPGWLARWAYLAELNPLERSFITIYRSLHWLGEKTSPAQTPTEAAEELARQLPEVSREIHSLLNEYQQHLFGHKHGYLPLASQAEKTIRKKALRAAAGRRWKEFRGILRHNRP
jgi:transglutaminase-like putative cysteine protease